MTKKLLLTALAAAALGGTAIAGHKQAAPVFIGGDQAGGALGDARASGNNVEYIGCSIFGGATTADPAGVFCFARDENDKYLACNTSAPAAITAASSFGPTTYVTFAVDKNGYCRFVWTLNQSYHAPPVP